MDTGMKTVRSTMISVQFWILATLIEALLKSYTIGLRFLWQPQGRGQCHDPSNHNLLFTFVFQNFGSFSFSFFFFSFSCRPRQPWFH
jgi:hypothetical protein